MKLYPLQIESGDGLPPLICLQCVHQVSQAYTFKQQCEQSDANLRQFLGKPLLTKLCKSEPANNSDLYNMLLLDSFGIDDDSSNESDEDDDFKSDFGLPRIQLDPSEEKIIAQRQLLKAAKMQKSKMSKKKLLAKAGKIGTFYSFEMCPYFY